MTCRNKKELAHPGNKGLDIAVSLLKPIKDKYANVTWAGGGSLCHQSSELCARVSARRNNGHWWDSLAHSMLICVPHHDMGRASAH